MEVVTGQHIVLSLGYATLIDGTTIGTSMNRFNSTLRIDYNFSKKLRFGANCTYTQTDKDANWATTVRSEAFKKMPNKSPYVIDDVTHLPLDQYFNRQTTDWEGVFKSSNDKGDATNYNPVAMAKESKNNTLQRETRAIIDANYKITTRLHLQRLCIYQNEYIQKHQIPATICNRCCMDECLCQSSLQECYVRKFVYTN